MRLLLVEPEATRNRELSEIFSDLNYKVLTAQTMQEAADAVKKENPDVVVASADGAGQGLDLLKALRKDKKTKELPVVVVSGKPDAEGKFSKLKSKAGKEGYVNLPAPAEDIVDWVERLIGLPSPPSNGSGGEGAELAFPGRAEAGVGKDREVVELQRELDALREQIHFYEKQLEQVSMSGEKESREMDQVLDDLQKDFEKEQKGRQQLQDELKLLKTDLATKDDEAKTLEKKLGTAQDQIARDSVRLKEELDSLRETYNDSQEKHKRAQNALREYYKPKVTKVKSLQKTIASLESKITELTEQIKEHKGKAEDFEKETDELKQEIVSEREKAKKARDAIKELSKTLDE